MKTCPIKAALALANATSSGDPKDRECGPDCEWWIASTTYGVEDGCALKIFTQSVVNRNTIKNLGGR